jgi:hypothetical protein
MLSLVMAYRSFERFRRASTRFDTPPCSGRHHPVSAIAQITAWKTHVVESACGLFGSTTSASAPPPAIDVKTLHAKIGELTLENDFLSGALSKAGLLSAKR